MRLIKFLNYKDKEIILKASRGKNPHEEKSESIRSLSSSPSTKR